MNAWSTRGIPLDGRDCIETTSKERKSWWSVKTFGVEQHLICSCRLGSSFACTWLSGCRNRYSSQFIQANRCNARTLLSCLSHMNWYWSINIRKLLSKFISLQVRQFVHLITFQSTEAGTVVPNKISCQRIPPINGYGEVLLTTGFERKTKMIPELRGWRHNRWS